MRAFVALEAPGEVLDLLTGFQRELTATGADLKLVERDNLHFTVRFLGEITDALAADAVSRLSRLSLKSTRMEVRGAGAFPSPSRPRVVWAGVSKEHQHLIAPMAKAVIDSLEGIGEHDDRPFQAHITLARVRSNLNAHQLEALLRENSDRSFGTAQLTALKLKSSVLTPRGPVYSDIGVYPLT
ncbi:MAG: RNA 2',3'-cyclic phosphodiesterase [Thaumarchaeota archaeon]|nr:RNA 2',3'-cyclic phosphodiesterase [Nitrososphaerota archaeon]